MKKSLLTIIPAALLVTLAILLIVDEDVWKPDPVEPQAEFRAPEPEPPEPAKPAPVNPTPPARSDPDPAKQARFPRVEDRPDKQSVKEWKDEMHRLCRQEFKKKKFESARFCFQMLIAHDPKDAEANLGMGIVNARMGNKTEAYWSYMKYLELNPEGKRAKDVSRVIKTYEDFHMGTGKFAKPAPKQQERQEPPPADYQFDSLPDQELAASLKKQLSVLNGCAASQRKRDPSITGTLMLSFTIDGSGKVSKVEILTPEHKGTFAAGCIKYAIKRVKIPDYSGDPVTIFHYPIKLGA